MMNFYPQSVHLAGDQVMSCHGHIVSLISIKSGHSIYFFLFVSWFCLTSLSLLLSTLVVHIFIFISITFVVPFTRATSFYCWCVSHVILLFRCQLEIERERERERAKFHLLFSLVLALVYCVSTVSQATRNQLFQLPVQTCPGGYLHECPLSLSLALQPLYLWLDQFVSYFLEW